MSDVYASTAAVVIPAIGIAAVLEFRATIRRSRRRIAKFENELSSFEGRMQADGAYFSNQQLRKLKERRAELRGTYGCLIAVSLLAYFLLAVLALAEGSALWWLANEAGKEAPDLDPELALGLTLTMSCALGFILVPASLASLFRTRRPLTMRTNDRLAALKIRTEERAGFAQRAQPIQPLRVNAQSRGGACGVE
ncbi:hypothetical protein [Streptomyces sp. NPDC127112]|uniref:hypothetical protein n=1 Tax=Streptomyces sp. NPDC127112 TaxID=3345364 RepID=UPI003639AE28